MRNFRKVLVANRGEIALRIVRACAEVGIESVAVFSEADRTALHVRAADEAYPIGPSPSPESYLRSDRLIDVARRSGADAVHPGYGFLAENADFAEAVLDAGLVWIGPSPAAMRLLGDKISARHVVQAAGVPTVPGSDVAVDDLAEAARAAERVGYPVLIKASAGGGGKGMRLVRDAAALGAAIRTARGEALTSFGSDTVYIERFLESVRHVEIQIMADSFGNVVHLGERECSIQRRHQKLIEESPSVAVDAKLREEMGKVAVAAARASGYSSAGTVEFLLDRSGNFYFLEVNTRLQVEHPVTEMVTGIDLVLEQFRVASGRPLKLEQSNIELRGHSIECRIAAEDPFQNFAPSLGEISALAEPSGPGVRVDSGLYRGGRVSIYYDPMVAKLIVWAPSRAHAILRMRRALQEYRVVGIQTNIPFHMGVMNSMDFQRGRYDTNFVEAYLADTTRDPSEGKDELAQVAATFGALVADRAKKGSGARTRPGDGKEGRNLSKSHAWRYGARRGGWS